MKKVPSGIVPVIAISRNATTPLHRQVYEAYRSAIVENTLRPGQRVPSTRTLAADLGISRIPVLNAYAQLLAEGYIESRVGAGTVVARSISHATAPELRNVGSVKVRSHPRRVAKRNAPLDSATNLTRQQWGRPGPFRISQIAFDHFPLRVWNSLVLRQCRNTSTASFDYADPMGLLSLREVIAVYLRTARGVRCEPEQIMIVSGSQQALEISVLALLDTGSQVWIEEPGYRFAKNVFALHACRVVPVPVDQEGIDVLEGIRRCGNARAALVTPSHQYPLGVTMSASRRFQLLDWAENSGAWIIEDDYDSEYRYESLPIASLQGLDRNCRVIYIGTFSKVLFPSLRLGYLVIPSDMVEHFLAVRFSMDIGPPTFLQGVLADFLREGHFSRHIRRMRSLYGERRSALIASLQKDLGVSAEVTGGQAGLHLTLTLEGIRDVEIAERAAHRNLWVTPLSSSYMGNRPRSGFVLGFAGTPAEEVPKAIRKLRSLLESR